MILITEGLGNMHEVKSTLKRLALYYLLLAVNIIPCASILPDRFPTRNVSSIYLLFLSVCLVLYYAYRLPRAGGLSVIMKSLSCMALLLILLRGIKYSVFAGVDVLARHTWYLYYVPMLLIPLFFFYIALLISSKDELRILKKWYWIGAVTVVMILLVLTNDLHQQVFLFQPGYAGWDGQYSYGWLIYIITAWQYSLYLAAVFVLGFKCSISSAKKYAWLTVIPFVIGIAESILLATEKMPKLNGTYIIELPETLIFMVAGILECCIQLGMIPTNKGYVKLFQAFPIRAQITDSKGKTVYASGSAIELTVEQFDAPDGARIGAHTVLHKMELPGGFGFWQDDLTELDRLNEELEGAKEALSQEAELIRLQNELAEKQAKIEQRTALYDTIAKHTQRQSRAISRLAEAARASSDAAVRETCCRQITLFGAFIKRYANLMLLSDKCQTIEAGELAVSFSEVLRYLNFSGIPAELINTSDGEISVKAALAVFETFGMLLEANIKVLRGVFVNLSSSETAVCKLTMEHLSVSVADGMRLILKRANIQTDILQEDDVTYICFTLPGRGCEA